MVFNTHGNSQQSLDIFSIEEEQINAQGRPNHWKIAPIEVKHFTFPDSKLKFI